EYASPSRSYVPSVVVFSNHWHSLDCYVNLGFRKFGDLVNRSICGRFVGNTNRLRILLGSNLVSSRIRLGLAHVGFRPNKNYIG
nr:hypothetical protein [Tanacetum cinerariifolium]